ncbi:MAG: hypothetical protein LDL31_08270 [Prosthecobacter sp.]|jgi:hypothetical protein|nr:hypothetical protein [Prosthecobacter sp.]
MTTILKRRGDSFRWKFDSWEAVLELAQEFGWQPAGTKPPRGTRVADWDADDYVSCNGQQMTAPDVAAMADALSKALKKIPTKPNKPLPKPASKALKEFCGWHREGLSDFVSFCKDGAFRITY